jgi:putative peptidoglycan lipid II flippase
MQESDVKAVSRGAVSFFSGTFLSRITGMLRDVSMAFCFGSHPAIAAFMVAYRFANLFRRLVGEGPLPSGFIPHFESLRRESPKEGAVFFRDVFFSLFFLLVVLVFILSSILFVVLHYGGLSNGTKEVLSLTLTMMPGLVFICLYAISSALLQCERKFFLPGVAPVLFNLTWIMTVFLFRDSIPDYAAVAISWGVVIGFFLQWALLIPSMGTYLKSALSWKEIFGFRLFSQEVKAILKPFLLGVIGVSATQINSLFDAIFARCASLEGPAYLWYAIRIEQLPLALFGIALSAALLPPLARAVSKEEWAQFHSLLRYSFSKSFHFIFPCSIALFVLAASGVNLLYGRGDFSEEATCQTILCLWGYGLGLLPAVFVLLLAPAFYSQKNFRLPMKAAFISVGLNLILNAFFVFVCNFGAVSIAISTSVAAWFNFFFLMRALQQKDLFDPSLYKAGMAAVMAGLSTFFLSHYLVGDATWDLLVREAYVWLPRSFGIQLLQFFTLSGVFILSFISYAWIFNVNEVLGLFKLPERKGPLKF